MPAPTISSFFPTTSIKVGESLTIYGTGLDQGAPTVRFGTNVAPTIQGYGPGYVQVLAPIIPGGTYNVTVQNSGGTSNGPSFTLTPIVPYIDSAWITSPINVGEIQHLIGLDFAYYAAPVVTIEGNQIWTIAWGGSNTYSATNASFRIPPGIPNASNYKYRIVNGLGGSTYTNSNNTIRSTYTITVTQTTIGSPAVGISSKSYSIDNGANWIGISQSTIELPIGTSVKFKGVFNSTTAAPHPYCEIVCPPGDVGASFPKGTTKTLTTDAYSSSADYAVSFNVFNDGQ